jgi:hypothetical protein
MVVTVSQGWPDIVYSLQDSITFYDESQDSIELCVNSQVEGQGSHR